MASLLDTSPFSNGSRPVLRELSYEVSARNGSRERLRHSPNGSGPASVPRVGASAPRRHIHVLVADPQELFCEALSRHLAFHDDFCVFEAVRNNRDALSFCAGHEVDVLLCAEECPSLSPRAVQAELGSRSPGTRVLVICEEAAPDEERALRAGAWGAVSRRHSGEHFVRAIRAVAGNQLWASRDLLCRLAQTALDDPAAVPKKVRSLLSDREKEIVQLLGVGLTNDAIAERLFVESSTIRTHLRRIFRKLGVHDRRSAVLAADLIGSLGSDGR